MNKKILYFFYCLILITLISACSLPFFGQAATSQPQQPLIITAAANTPTMDIVGTLVQSTLAAFQQQSEQQTANAPTVTVEIATATLTETPTQTETPTDVVSSLGTPTWKDEFNVAKSWYMDDDQYTNIDINNGSLVLTSLQAVTWTGWSMHYNKLQNFYMEGVINVPTCSAPDRYGLAFRSPDYIKGYFFGVDCSGQYNLSLYNGDKFITIIPWTASGNIHTGANAQNVLGIKAIGDKITLSVNGVELQTITNTDYASGTFGAFIAAVNTPGFTIKMDEIRYWTLP
jgi:hypothetical protein